MLGYLLDLIEGRWSVRVRAGVYSDVRQLSLSAVVCCRPAPVVRVARSVASKEVSGQAGTGWIGSGQLERLLATGPARSEASAAGGAGSLGEPGQVEQDDGAGF